MKVLITGATGLVGGALLSRLAEEDHDVVVLTRDPDKARRRLGVPCKVYGWDPLAGPPPVEALAGIDAVAHLAGEPVADRRWTAEQKNRIRDSRVVGTKHLAQAIAARRGKPIVVLAASAIGYYGSRGDEELHEYSPPGTGFLADVVRAWEAEAKTIPYGHARLVLLRIGLVLAAGGGALRKMVPVFQSGTAGPVGNGAQWLSWIHIDDLVDLAMHALDNAALEGAVNAVAPQPVTNAEFTRALAKQLKRPAFLRLPAGAARAVMGEMADEMLLSSARVLPDKALAAGFRFRFPRIEEALAELFPDGAADEFSVDTWIPSPPEKVFSFFADEKNLKKLTPPSYAFEIIGKNTPEITEGTLIDYKMKVKGIPMRWQARIEQWEPNRSFVDVQLRGPFSAWRHSHQFVPSKGGTLVRDRVRYAVPGGVVGRGLWGGTARKDLERTFEYRREQLRKEFP